MGQRHDASCPGKQILPPRTTRIGRRGLPRKLTERRYSTSGGLAMAPVRLQSFYLHRHKGPASRFGVEFHRFQVRRRRSWASGDSRGWARIWAAGADLGRIRAGKTSRALAVPVMKN